MCRREVTLSDLLLSNALVAVIIAIAGRGKERGQGSLIQKMCGRLVNRKFEKKKPFH